MALCVWCVWRTGLGARVARGARGGVSRACALRLSQLLADGRPRSCANLPLPWHKLHACPAFPRRPQAGVEWRKNEEREAAEAARQARLRGPAGQLADVLLSRGWRIGRPQFSIGEAWLPAAAARCQCQQPGSLADPMQLGMHACVTPSPPAAALPRASAHPYSKQLSCTLVPPAAGDRKPYLDAAGQVHWPALFFYPEASMASDTLEDFCEKDTFRWVGWWVPAGCGWLGGWVRACIHGWWLCGWAWGVPRLAHVAWCAWGRPQYAARQTA